MDDLFKSVPSFLEACNLQVGLVKLLSLGGLNLTKWISNGKDFLNAVPEKERAQSVRSIGDGNTLLTERSLGFPWDVQNNTFIFRIEPKALADTRRKVVCLSSSLFDPFVNSATLLWRCQRNRILCCCLLSVFVSWWLGTVRICGSQDSRRTC